MPDERAVRPRVRFQFHGNVVGIQPVRAVGDQHAQRVRAHDSVQFFDSGFGKVGRCVHGRAF